MTDTQPAPAISLTVTPDIEEAALALLDKYKAMVRERLSGNICVDSPDSHEPKPLDSVLTAVRKKVWGELPYVPEFHGFWNAVHAHNHHLASSQITEPDVDVSRASWKKVQAVVAEVAEKNGITGIPLLQERRESHRG